MKSLINELCQIPAPSGHESGVRDAIRRLVSAYADSVSVDDLGNLIVRKGKKTEGGLKLMVSSHMDESGLIATHIDEKGFIRFTTIGSIPAQFLAGSRVLFLNGTRGIIQPEPQTDGSKNLSPEQFFIDVGASKPADCPVKIGETAVIDQTVFEQNGKLLGKALSSRTGCAVLIDILREIKKTPHELVFVFTAQGEVGNRGIQAAAYGLDPDLGIAVEVTDVGDTPSAGKMDVKLAKGPAVKIRDAGMICDPRIVKWMSATAGKTGITVQKEISVHVTTDASQVQTNRSGVPAGVLSIPCRYIHSSAEMIDLDDLQHTRDLLMQLLSSPVIL